jgi:hypothetical protein
MGERIKFLIEKIKKYDGEFVFLWHSSNLMFVSIVEFNKKEVI